MKSWEIMLLCGKCRTSKGFAFFFNILTHVVKKITEVSNICWQRGAWKLGRTSIDRRRETVFTFRQDFRAVNSLPWTSVSFQLDCFSSSYLPAEESSSFPPSNEKYLPLGPWGSISANWLALVCAKQATLPQHPFFHFADSYFFSWHNLKRDAKAKHSMKVSLHNIWKPQLISNINNIPEVEMSKFHLTVCPVLFMTGLHCSYWIENPSK